MKIESSSRSARLMAALSVPLATFLVAGCGSGDNPIAPRELEQRVVVHSVLQAGADTVAVLLTRTPRHFSPGPADSFTPLTGALVRLIAGEDTLYLTEQSATGNRCATSDGGPVGEMGTGCYLGALAGGVRAGESYELVVEHPAHDIIHGRATVPTPPAILEPVALTTIEVGANSAIGERLGPLPIRWSDVEPGRRLELAIRMGGEGCWVEIVADRRHGGTFGIELTGLDSTAVVDRWIYCAAGHQPVDSYPATLYLTTFDSAYTTYRQKNADFISTPQTDASAGVEGALGVFAGAATARIPITLQVRWDEVGTQP